MPQVARLEGRLTLNDAEFNNAINRAEKRAQTFGGRVESSFQGLFKRTPGRRAERALGGLLGDLSTGNFAQGIGQFAGKLTGLGLAAGVGIGAAVELFAHLRSSVLEVTAAHDQLDKQMSKPLRLTSIEGLGAAIDNLQQKQNTFTHGFTNYLYDIAHQKGAKGLLDLGKAGIADEEEMTAAITKRQDAEKLQGRNELIRANVLARLENDPKRKALAEMRFKFDERRDAIMSKPDKGSAARLQAIDVEQEAAEKKFKTEKSASEVKLQTEEKLARLVKLGLKPEDQAKVKAGLELQNINNDLANETDKGKIRTLSLEKLNKENELRSFYKQKEANPFAAGTVAARNFENDQGGFGTLAGRAKEMNDAGAFGTLAANAANRGDIPLSSTANPNSEVVGAVNKVNDTLIKLFEGT